MAVSSLHYSNSSSSSTSQPSHPPTSQSPKAKAAIKDIHLFFAQHKLTSKYLVTFYLNQIQSINPLLRCVLEVNPDALTQAERADLPQGEKPSQRRTWKPPWNPCVVEGQDRIPEGWCAEDGQGLVSFSCLFCFLLAIFCIFSGLLIFFLFMSVYVIGLLSISFNLIK